jgi:hypothetical protein
MNYIIPIPFKAINAFILEEIDHPSFYNKILEGILACFGTLKCLEYHKLALISI